MSNNAETAILAGGCFWGVEDLLRHHDGVISTRVGYTGGANDNPTYRNHPGHAEAVEIVFDPERTSYRDILEVFFQIHDPTTKDRQGYDIGSDYRSEIFYTSDEQRRVAEDTIADVDASGLWPGRSLPRSARPAASGRPKPKTRAISSATGTAKPATSRGRTGSCHTARPRPNSGENGFSSTSEPDSRFERRAAVALEYARRSLPVRLAPQLDASLALARIECWLRGARGPALDTAVVQVEPAAVARALDRVTVQRAAA
jgi:peptide-methionine (S)-S-oxide reductase